MNTIFDNEFKSTASLKWLPWVGSNYTTNGRLLIVGESHYADGTEKNIQEFESLEATRECVYDMGVGGNVYDVRFFPNMHYVLGGVNHHKTKEIWDNFAFFNLIQRVMRDKHDRPKYLDYRNGIKAFFELMNIISPDRVIFGGVEAEWHLREELKNSPFTEVNFKYGERISRTYPRVLTIKNENNKVIEIVFIQHPSHHFSHSSWREYLLKNHSESLKPFEYL